MKTVVKYARKKIPFGENNNVVWRLIIANAVIFTGLYFVKIVYLITGQADQSFIREILPWAILPARLGTILTRPWTLISFMFVHQGFIELLTNMLWLWWFGTLLQEFAGPKKVFPLYLFGGLTGAVTFIAAHYALPHLPPGEAFWGAGASIMAITVAVTVLVPGYRIFPMLNGGIPLWIITCIFAGIDVAGMPVGQLTGHLGGAILGVLFAWQLKKGNDWTGWASNLMDRFERIFDPELRKQGYKPSRLRLFYKQDVPPYRRIGNVPEKKVDELLDKISREGYDSLSQEEKDTLVRASRQDE